MGDLLRRENDANSQVIGVFSHDERGYQGRESSSKGVPRQVDLLRQRLSSSFLIKIGLRNGTGASVPPERPFDFCEAIVHWV